MAKYERIVTTQAGLELLENAAYIGGSIQFTALKTGSGKYDGTEDLSTATDLKSVRQTFVVGSVTRKDSDIVIRTLFNNNNVTEGYTMTEIGLYAANPATGEDILYAVVIAAAGNEDYFPPHANAPTSITFEMYIGITESEEAVTFTVAAGGSVPVESFEEIISGEMPVGNSKQLGGETAEKWQTKIDNIQTTSRATLSTAGWYRVAELNEGYGNTCLFKIGNEYNSGGCDEHLLMYTKGFNNGSFHVISSKKTNAQIFSKVREVIEGSKLYIEVYYANSYKNPCFFTVLSFHDDKGNAWQAVTPTLTSETVDGVTVTTTYDIPSNASPVTDLDLANATGLKMSAFGGAVIERTNGTVCAPVYKGNGEILGYLGFGAKGVATVYGADGSTLGNIATTKDLANYLPLSGGTLSGKQRFNYNGRKVTLEITSGGDFYIWDETNNKAILHATLAGGGTFHGTATGNLPLEGGGTVKGSSATIMELNNTDTTSSTALLKFSTAKIGTAGWFGFSGVDNPIVGLTSGSKTLLHTGNVGSYALPLDGGGVVKSTSSRVMSVNHTDGADAYIGYYSGTSTLLGMLGFTEADKPMFIQSNGNTGQYLLHTGNSAKVAIQETAPTDTTALWVW